MLGWPFWVCGIRQDRSGGWGYGEKELDKVGGSKALFCPQACMAPREDARAGPPPP